mmetsp:Transcript_14659/g.46734  ORF Transcript_14659/g.46734 Transcript_14659/m.46734 type:complete len:207 (-) Transcript_14659:494-1114(-)
MLRTNPQRLAPPRCPLRHEPDMLPHGAKSLPLCQCPTGKELPQLGKSRRTPVGCLLPKDYDHRHWSGKQAVFRHALHLQRLPIYPVHSSQLRCFLVRGYQRLVVWTIFRSLLRLVGRQHQRQKVHHCQAALPLCSESFAAVVDCALERLPRRRSARLRNRKSRWPASLAKRHHESRQEVQCRKDVQARREGAAARPGQVMIQSPQA